MIFVVVILAALVGIRVVADGTGFMVIKEKDPVVAQLKYIRKADKEYEKEKYEKSNEFAGGTGYMLKEEYEDISVGKDRMFIKVEDAQTPPAPDMKYVPQYTYKFVRYNNPPGNHELRLPRSLNFDRQLNVQGIVSSDFKKLVYPSVYYYADDQCTTCDLFLLPLDTSLNDTERVLKANVVHRVEKPLISTEKSIDDRFVFRTLTPVDFSEDNTRLVVKEKTGYIHDGIWKTDLWVYDFNTEKAKKLVEIRDAIINYWQIAGGVNFDDRRWDIYPLGFDVNDQNRILVCAYAYTGKIPKFLGTWSIDVDGERAELMALNGTNLPVSMVGFKLIRDSVVDPEEVKFEAKRAKKTEKKRKKEQKKILKEEKKERKLAYKRRLKQIDSEYKLGIYLYKQSKKAGKGTKHTS